MNKETKKRKRKIDWADNQRKADWFVTGNRGRENKKKGQLIDNQSSASVVFLDMTDFSEYH